MNTIKNSVQLIGHLGRDLEIKTFENGNKIARCTVATNDYYNNNLGEKIQDTQWHNIIAWGKLADLMATLLEKGNEVIVRGKLTHRNYEDKEGIKRYTSEIIVNEFVKLTRREMELIAQ